MLLYGPEGDWRQIELVLTTVDKAEGNHVMTSGPSYGGFFNLDSYCGCDYHQHDWDMATVYLRSFQGWVFFGVVVGELDMYDPHHPVKILRQIVKQYRPCLEARFKRF